MKKILLSSMLFAGICAYSQINTSEGFEGTAFPPPNWSTSVPAFSKISLPGFPCTGAAGARKQFFGTLTTNSTANLTYASTISNTNAINVSFNYTAKANTATTNAVTAGNMIVSYSVDGGTTWVNLGAQLDFTADVATCTPFAATIPAGVVPLDSNFRFRITGSRGVSTTGTVDWFLTIDDVEIAQPDTCPVPTNLAASNITANTALISWTGSSTPPVNGYDVYYSTSNTAPTSATIPTVSGVVGNSATISGLLPFRAYYVWVKAKCAGTDQSNWIFATTSFETKCLQTLAITSTTGATVCPNQSATLSAVADTGATINWYDAAMAGNLLTTGSSYTTPALSATTNYYVCTSTGTSGQQAAKAIYSPNPTNNGGAANFGLVFDALSSFTLQSVTIYPVSTTGASGTIIIDILNNTGAIVHTKTVNVTGSPVATPTPQVITLDFSILAGNDYKIRPRTYTGITGLMHDPIANAPAGNYGYPFTLANVLSVKTSASTAHPAVTPRNDIYYYFYDWKVSTKCESERQTVTATVDAACLATSEVDKREVIKVYPNPFSEEINIADFNEIKSISLTDVSGKLIEIIKKPTSVLKFKTIKEGLYILIFEMKDGSRHTQKVIKKYK